MPSHTPPYSDFWVSDCLTSPGYISVCHTVREGEDKTATNKPNRRIPGIVGGSGSSARLICNIKIDSTPSGLGGPAFEALPSESPSEASKYDA